MFNKRFLTGITAATPLLYPKTAFASEPSGFYVPEAITQFFSITSLGEFIGAVLTLLYLISGVLFFVQLVVGGFQWIISGGDSGNIEKARGRIVSAFVGLSIVALAYAAIILVEYFFGITVISNDARIPLPFTK